MKHLIKWTLPFALISTAALAEVSVSEARATVDAFKRRDPDIEQFFTNSHAYVVFPEIKKGAFVFGGAGGEGILFQGGKALGSVKMTQVTVGAQVGGKSYSEIVFITDEAALYRFKRGDAQLSASASATLAGEESRVAPKPEHGLEVFQMPISGVMAEASVGGQRFEFTPFGPPAS
jgi:lipid-binding SYLF domain-containing protein